MVSEVTATRLKLLYPDFKVRVLRIYEDVQRITGRPMNATETLRSFARQQALFEQGRTQTNGVWTVSDPKLIVTKAPPGMSLHAYGLAVDSSFAGRDPYLAGLPKVARDAAWRAYGTIANSYGCRWGGDWNFNGIQDVNDFDKPHCELAYGLALHELLELYSHGGLRAVWSALDKIRGVEIGGEWQNNLLPENV